MLSPIEQNTIANLINKRVTGQGVLDRNLCLSIESLAHDIMKQAVLDIDECCTYSQEAQLFHSVDKLGMECFDDKVEYLTAAMIAHSAVTLTPFCMPQHQAVDTLLELVEVVRNVEL